MGGAFLLLAQNLGMGGSAPVAPVSVDIFLCPVRTGNDVWLCDPTVAHAPVKRGRGKLPIGIGVWPEKRVERKKPARELVLLETEQKPAPLDMMLLLLDEDLFLVESVEGKTRGKDEG
jgi:hypothetical protein